jgi:Fe-S cluster biogenesis protein NfuA
VSEIARATAVRVERLLGEIESSAGPPTWARVEELVRALLELQREGLARVLELVSVGGEGSATLSALADDELVSSLLLLHGLHPLPTAERVRRALVELRPHLESHAAEVELLDVGSDGATRLRVSGISGCAGSAIEHAVRRAVQEAAPEVTRLDIELPGEPRAPHGLVQLKLKKPENRI